MFKIIKVENASIPRTIAFRSKKLVADVSRDNFSWPVLSIEPKISDLRVYFLREIKVSKNLSKNQYFDFSEGHLNFF